MDLKKTLRCLQTRRFTGRRGVTPIRSKLKKSIPKTRGHKVEKKPYVPLRKHTSTQQLHQRQETNKEEYSENQKGEGDESGNSTSGRQDEEKCKEIVQSGNSENSKESVHPGPVQTLLDMSQQTIAKDQTSAVKASDDKTEIEAEVLQ